MADSSNQTQSRVRHAGEHPRHPRHPRHPGRVTHWGLVDVHHHLQFAVDIELWTIPYYLTVMYSIKNPSEPAFRLIQSVVNQEMLHAELAANVYNSFRPRERLKIEPATYTRDAGVPHLNFDLDVEAEQKYGPSDASLGGLDSVRIDTMCLIELPESTPPDLHPDRTEYATIGDFYTALRHGMQEHAKAVLGKHNQVDYFKNFYRYLNHTTVTKDGSDGLTEALGLIDVITEQGEGRTHTDETIPLVFQNTATGYEASSSHFRKFNSIRDSLLRDQQPETYTATDPDRKDTEPQLLLVDNFAKLLSSMEELFNGGPGGDFGVLMPTVGANILNCWRHGVVPQFSPTRSKA